MFKVLISDSMSNVAQKIFEKNKISVEVKTGLSEEEIIKIIPEYDGMVVRSATKVTKNICLLYTSPSPRDLSTSRMPSSA